MVVTLPKEICGHGNPKPAQEVKDIDKKVTYIPSNLRVGEVKNILRESGEKATDNWKNPVYRKFKIKTYIGNLLAISVCYLIMYYLVFKHVTFPIKYEYIISVSGSNLLQGFIFVSYIFIWFGIAGSIRKILTSGEITYRKYVENGEIIEDKYEKTALQITTVYNEIERFIDFYGRIYDDSKYIYSINETNDTLIVEYPQRIGTGQEKFYFGPKITEIVDEKRGIIDFSKLDTLYGLV
jgi:hypothetical protein